MEHGDMATSVRSVDEFDGSCGGHTLQVADV